MTRNHNSNLFNCYRAATWLALVGCLLLAFEAQFPVVLRMLFADVWHDWHIIPYLSYVRIAGNLSIACFILSMAKHCRCDYPKFTTAVSAVWTLFLVWQALRLFPFYTCRGATEFLLFKSFHILCAVLLFVVLSAYNAANETKLNKVIYYVGIAGAFVVTASLLFTSFHFDFIDDFTRVTTSLRSLAIGYLMIAAYLVSEIINYHKINHQ